MSTDKDQAIEALTARIASLEQRLEDLVTDRRITMRDDYECPVCGDTELLHVTEPPDRMYIGSGAGVLASVRGQVEIWVCRECLFIEHTVKSLEGLHIDGKRIIAISGAGNSRSADSP